MLCAYYKAETEFTLKELTSYLSGRLPDYMIPSVFIKVDTFPMNQSGKIDKSKLPEPFELISKGDKALPRNELERKMADTWSEVLEIPQIGIDDDFFGSGGDSLKAIKVVTKLELGIKIVDLYTYPTIRKLSDNLQKLNKDTGLLIKLSRRLSPTRRNVICFPFGGGSAISYVKISSSSDKGARLNI
jgi:acyl carrier protein